MKLKKAIGIFDAVKIKRKIIFAIIPTGVGWTAAVTGTGAVAMSVFFMHVTSGATAASTAIQRCYTFGLGVTGPNRFNFTKRNYISANIAATNSVANSTRYFHIKEATTHGDLAAIGIGLKIVNLTLYGESYGTEHGEVELMALTANIPYKVDIEHDPVAGVINWYVNGVLKGSQVTASKIPSAETSSDAFMVASVGNGATTTDARLYLSTISIMQEV